MAASPPSLEICPIARHSPILFYPAATFMFLLLCVRHTIRPRAYVVTTATNGDDAATRDWA